MSDPVTLAKVIESAIALVGLVLLWWCVLRGESRKRWVAELPRWEIAVADILTFGIFVIGAWFFVSLVGTLGVRLTHLSPEEKLIIQSGVSEAGMLLGIVLFAALYPEQFCLGKVSVRRSVVSGIVTFFVAMPFVYLVGFVWAGLLKLAGLPLETQPAIELFARTKSHGWLAFLAFIAVVMAPLAEEFIFRAGLFRYFRGRLPRWAAFIAPACLFAAAHASLASFGQLVALAVVFSVAYERTGQIGTPIVAHAVFNLNTVVLLLAGIDLSS